MANLDLKKPAVQKLVLAALVAVGALAVFYFTQLLPFGFPANRTRIATLQGDFERKSSELARARASVADLPRFEAEYDQLHQRWELASELLPADHQVATLMRRITIAGQQTGISFGLFKPGALKPLEYHCEVPITISVNGAYHDVGSFLAELANLRRIVTVSNLKLTNNLRAGGGTTTAEFVASAYSLQTTPVTTTATAKGDRHGR